MKNDRNRQVNVYMPPDEYEVVRRMSKRMGLSISGCIRELYRETLQVYNLLPVEDNKNE